MTLVAAEQLISALASGGSPCPSPPDPRAAGLAARPRSVLPPCPRCWKPGLAQKEGCWPGMLLHRGARSWYRPPRPGHRRWEGHGSRGGGESRAPGPETPRASEVEKVSLTGSFRGSESGVLAGGKALISCCSVGLLLDLQSKMLLDWKKCNNSSFA